MVMGKWKMAGGISACTTHLEVLININRQRLLRFAALTCSPRLPQAFLASTVQYRTTLSATHHLRPDPEALTISSMSESVSQIDHRERRSDLIAGFQHDNIHNENLD